MKSNSRTTLWVVAIALILIGQLIIPVLGNTAHAQTGKYTLLEPLPCVSNNTSVGGNSSSNCSAGNNVTSIDLKQYIPYMFNLLIAGAAAVAVVMIIWGGFMYMTTDSWTGKSEGAERAKNAVFGLLMVLCTYLILKTVNPSLVAIPATIVPKLEGAPSADLGGVFGSLQSEIASYDTAQYHADMTAAKNQLDANQQQVDATNKQISAIEDTIRSVTGDASMTSSDIRSMCVNVPTGNSAVDTACLQLAQNVNDVNRLIGDSQLVVAQKALESKVYTFNPLLGTAGQRSYSDVLADEQAAYQSKRQAMINSNAQPDQIKALDNYDQYQRSLLAVENQVALAYSDPGSLSAEALKARKDATIAQISQIQNDYAQSGKSDPALYKQLLDKIATSKTQIVNVGKK